MNKTTRKVTLMCDKCHNAIDNPNPTLDDPNVLVRLRAYGLSFHPRCFTEISGPELIDLMAEFDTYVANMPQVYNLDANGQPIGLTMQPHKATQVNADGSVSQSDVIGFRNYTRVH